MLCAPTSCVQPLTFVAESQPPTDTKPDMKITLSYFEFFYCFAPCSSSMLCPCVCQCVCTLLFGSGCCGRVVSVREPCWTSTLYMHFHAHAPLCLGCAHPAESNVNRSCCLSEVLGCWARMSRFLLCVMQHVVSPGVDPVVVVTSVHLTSRSCVLTSTLPPILGGATQ